MSHLNEAVRSRMGLPHLCGAGMVLSALALASPAAGEALIYSAETAMSHYANTYVVPAFSDAVKTATDGAYELDIYASSALASATGLIEAMAERTVDAGGPVYTYTPALLPTLNFISQLPGSSLEAAAATETLYFDCPQCQEELAENGTFVLVTNATENFRFFCKGTELDDVDDIPGLRLRAIGNFARIGAAIGMTPVNIPFNEAYDAMQRGMADCIAAGTSTIDSLQFWDVLDNVVTGLPLGTGHNWSLMAMSAEIWAEMDPAHKRAFLDAAPILLADDAYHAQAVSRAALERVAAEGHIKTIAAGPALQAAVADAKASLVATAIADAEGRGISEPQALADAFMRNLAKWDAIAAEIGAEGTWEAPEYTLYRAALAREIFDRVTVE